VIAAVAAEVAESLRPCVPAYPRSRVRHRLSPAALLVVSLVLAWGPCPGTVVRTFADMPEDAGGCGDCPCGGKRTPDAPPSIPTDDEGCPYCRMVGGRPTGLVTVEVPAPCPTDGAPLPVADASVTAAVAVLPPPVHGGADPPGPSRVGVVLLRV